MVISCLHFSCVLIVWIWFVEFKLSVHLITLISVSLFCQLSWGCHKQVFWNVVVFSADSCVCLSEGSPLWSLIQVTSLLFHGLKDWGGQSEKTRCAAAVMRELQRQKYTFECQNISERNSFQNLTKRIAPNFCISHKGEKRCGGLASSYTVKPDKVI